MATKKETIQFRVDTELKTQFFDLARKKGIPPSGLLRNLINTAIEYENSRMRKIEEDQTGLKWILLSILKYLHKQALQDRSQARWQNYLDSRLVDYLDELLMETRRQNGSIDWQRYWRKVDDAFNSRLSENPPLRAIHTNDEFLNRTRKNLMKSNEKPTGET